MTTLKTEAVAFSLNKSEAASQNSERRILSKGLSKFAVSVSGASPVIPMPNTSAFSNYAAEFIFINTVFFQRLTLFCGNAIIVLILL